MGEDDLVDVAVRLEVNHWNGAVEPQVILRELYRRNGGEAALEAAGWWQRFEAELALDPAQGPELEQALADGHERRVLTSSNAPAAVVGELASCGASVLAIAADAELRAGMAGEGVRLIDYPELERSTQLSADFDHVVSSTRRPPLASNVSSRTRARMAVTCTGSGAGPSGGSRSASWRCSWRSDRP